MQNGIALPRELLKRSKEETSIQAEVFSPAHYGDDWCFLGLRVARLLLRMLMKGALDLSRRKMTAKVLWRTY